jgi:uncharacterized YigZ family protein
MTDFIVPAVNFSQETRVANSRFIATIGSASTVAEAKIFIADISQLYADASHNVPAYIIGSGSSVISHCSDDGEPNGTAGRPALAVLTGSGLGDTVLVISRYFGGTKLGTGGLVKAYSNSARLAIDGVQKAKKINVHRASLISHYRLYEKITRNIKQLDGLIESEEFTENVKIEFLIPVVNLDTLDLAITELSQGKIKLILIDEIFAKRIPI